MIIIEIC